MVNEDDKLFGELHLMFETDGARTKELVDSGYLIERNRLHYISPKAEVFVEKYYEEKKDLVFKAISQQGSYYTNRKFVLDAAGMTDIYAAEVILDKLVEECKLKKNKDDDYEISK